MEEYMALTDVMGSVFVVYVNVGRWLWYQ